ncbi:alpha-2-macroglobulin-like isoform X2 [Stegostoma tigrinum]|uniref:alpha-2-macroglobulin-like isoform X2 n=1 Tax=Stegostoma tigrinum TaxID=3053191 RepID=UPI00286FF157|nr:alpha-2-macroglobulin-like isoform X2 [Stegostoma tigrinum]
MLPRAILLYLLLTAVQAGLHYVVLIPAEIRTNTLERVCVLLSPGNETYPQKLTIKNEQTQNILLEEELLGSAGHNCFQFTVADTEFAFNSPPLIKVTVHRSGPNITTEDSKNVILESYEPQTFVQTDKPVYKAGQTVKFRIVTLIENFTAVQEKYSLITVWDPKRNRIGQWRDVEPRQGIVDLAFDLMSEPLLGTYEIEGMQSQGRKFLHHFSVEEYVLPKAELKVKMPEKITAIDPTIHIEVCGRYTYGKPVKGQVNGTVCLDRMDDASDPIHCQHIFGEMDLNGCLSTDLSTDVFHFRESPNHRRIDAQFVLTEEGTGIPIQSSATCQVESEIMKITFEDVEDYYKPGIPYTAQIKIQYTTGQPVTNVTIKVLNSWKPGAILAVTDEKGMSSVVLETPLQSNELLSITAIYQDKHHQDAHHYNVSAHHVVKPFYSRSKSYFTIQKHQQLLACDSELHVKVHYIIRGIAAEADSNLAVFYLVMSRGVIVNMNSKTISIKGSEDSEGYFQLSLPISADLSPIARLLIFAVLPDGETIGDSAKFQISQCFRNKVTLHFSVAEDLPKSHISLDLRAEPDSLCGLRVVDRSVLLLKPETELSQGSIYSLLPVQDLQNYSNELKNHEQHYCKLQNPLAEPEPSEQAMGDLGQLLQNMGLQILTDTEFHKPIKCLFDDSYGFIVNGIPFFSKAYEMNFEMDSLEVGQIPTFSIAMEEEPIQLINKAGTDSIQPHISPRRIVKIRKYFPETWIWDLVPVGSSGSASFPVTVPDSITEWKGSMFCTSHVGIGISDTVTFNAFKPFFVELALPFSVVRTEGFVLKAKVFNYLTQCIMVKVTLLNAQGFSVTAESDAEHTTCICSQDSQTFSWHLLATGLGQQNLTVQAESIASETLCGNEFVIVPAKGALDVIRKSLLIKPEGIEIELTHSSLMCPAGKTITEEIQLELPHDVIKGSSRAYVTVLGDILSSAMQNLDGLLRLPTGCGEQNMVKFAPNIYILRYLNKTDQLTREIRDKAISYLQTGYQNQLTYKHHDGSFSAFGDEDHEGNTWLTAFVMKSFATARQYIFIDNDILEDTVRFFQRHQLESGCFQNLGYLFNNALKGGVNDHISLSAYVTSALLESTLSGSEMSLITNRALSCLRSTLETVNSTYTLSLLAYTFTLGQDQFARTRVLQRLEKLAIKTDRLTHWQQEETLEREEEHGYWWRAPSAEVEMTAYVLLALLSQPQITHSELDNATSIVRWLVKQRNPYGGFASTQDTVVALQALALYTELTHVGGHQSSVNVTSETTFHREFRVDDSNQLLLQREALTEIPGKYNVLITGSRCVLLETILRYNEPVKPKDSVFKLSVAMLEQNSLDPLLQGEQTYRIFLNVTYTGDRPSSNMVIVEVELLSGFSADKESYKNIEVNRLLQFSIDTIHQFNVENLQPAIVKVYDYYHGDDLVITEYEAPKRLEIV